eukprot:269361_1
MPSVQGFKEVPTYELEIIVAVSAAIQTFIFGYHLSSYDCKYENHKWVDCISLSLLVFFIMAVLITTLGYEWTYIDLKIYAFDNPDAQNIIYYIGICLLYIGNGLFIWLEYHLHFGIQSPWMDNDINMHRINVHIVELKTKIIDVTIKDEKVIGKKLIISGPFQFVRHPIIPIMLCWELGYGLATGAWFEFLAFVSFVSIELFHIISIEKSLLYHYGKEYYEYMKNKNAFCPWICGRICEMGLFNQSCICLCKFGNYTYKPHGSKLALKVHSFPHVDSKIVISHKHKVHKRAMLPSTTYGSVNSSPIESVAE